jgi:exonuclease SbcD
LRFLHTSDWHVGKMLRGRSRLEEHEAVHAEIIDIGVREKVDCVLVTGDLFDSLHQTQKDWSITLSPSWSHVAF